MSEPLPTITLNPSDYYHALNQQCTVTDLLWQYVQNVEDWSGVDWHTFYLNIPSDQDCSLFKTDPVINWFLSQGWDLNFTCMPPKSHYRWHIDTNGNRQTAINLALNEFDTCKTIWRAPTPWVRRFNTEIIDLNYRPRTYYLFNTQEEHCVYNFGMENRYLLTITPGQRFAVPEYHEGRYTVDDAGRYKEILQGYKLAYGQVFGEIELRGW
jgi:hypothetical protein